MEYTINNLARISGTSTRTLRYYDQIGLLKPIRTSSNGYRVYGKNEIDLLQQILFYKELDFSLDEIKKLVTSSDFNKEKSLRSHLTALNEKKTRIETLIENVSRTILSMEGEQVMSDKEKFSGFKQKLIKENEEKYGEEIREKYGRETVEASNAKLAGMTEEQWKKSQELSEEISKALKSALEKGDPASEETQRICDLHKQWLCMFWADGVYSKESHKGLVEMYVADPRFKKYYDDIIDGATVFLRDAVNIYCKE